MASYGLRFSAEALPGWLWFINLLTRSYQEKSDKAWQCADSLPFLLHAFTEWCLGTGTFYENNNNKMRTNMLSQRSLIYSMLMKFDEVLKAVTTKNTIFLACDAV
jgi:hypothetical protein